MRKRYDRTLKQVLARQLSSHDPHARISLDHPISQEGFTLDLVFRSSTPEAREVDFPPFLLTPHLCCQFRHAGSILYPLDFHRFLAQVLLYSHQENLEDCEAVSLMVVVSRVAVERFQGKRVYALNPVKEGVYLEEVKCRTVVIESNELAVIPENYPYLLISEGEKRREFIQRILRERNTYYVTHAYRLYREEVRAMAEEQGIELEEVLTPRDLIEDLGSKKLIEALLEGYLLTPKDLIEDLGSKKVIEALLELGGAKEIIEELGIGKIVEETGIRKIVEETGIRKIIEETGIERIIEEVGMEKIREYLKSKGVSC